jgi:hypothetical protein
MALPAPFLPLTGASGLGFRVKEHDDVVARLA